jgi:hypothetical protein
MLENTEGVMKKDNPEKLVSGLSFYITPSVFSNMYLSCVLCILCCQFLWIVLFQTIQRNWQHRIHKTQDKCMLENIEGVIKKDDPEKLATCILCILCCQFLWIVLLHSPVGIL